MSVLFCYSLLFVLIHIFAWKLQPAVSSVLPERLVHLSEDGSLVHGDGQELSGCRSPQEGRISA